MDVLHLVDTQIDRAVLGGGLAVSQCLKLIGFGDMPARPAVQIQIEDMTIIHPLGLELQHDGPHETGLSIPPNRPIKPSSNPDSPSQPCWSKMEAWVSKTEHTDGTFPLEHAT